LRKSIGHRIGPTAALALLCLILFYGCASAPGTVGGTVACSEDEYTAYPDVISQLLPDYTIKRTGNNDFAWPAQGTVTEVCDAQAIPALEAGLAEYWYPQYLAAVVIAADRGRTDAELCRWHDLASAGVRIGFNDKDNLLITAMAYGLEGEAFTLRGAVKLLAGLQAKGLLARGSYDAPLVICYDYQAAALGMEIIIPQEGTLAFVKGLLSNQPLDFAGDADACIAAAGLRPASAADYEGADRVKDYDHLNTVYRDIDRAVRRNVLRTRLYSSADGREHLMLALLYILLVTIWTATVIRRVMHTGVRYPAILLGVLLLGWAVLRLMKYQVPDDGTLNRYLWYGYYLFQPALPLVLLWLAWSVDQPEGRVKPPKWFALPAAATGALIALVFTNDLHNWVFRFDLSQPKWYSDYSHAFGYYVVLAVCIILVLAVIAILLIKGARNPRKIGFVLPLGLCALLAAWGVAFILRIPLAWESDSAVVIGLLALLSVETALYTGMIPANTRHRQLFAHSSLAMQIADSNGNVVYTSARCLSRHNEDALLFSTPIAGGHILWQEDIAALNRLHREVEAQAHRLTATNALLTKESEVKRAIEEERVRSQLLLQLEAEVAGNIGRLLDMIDNRESAARITLLLCYTKRRCNLFFRGLETQLLPPDELTICIDELAELAGHANVRIVTAGQIKTPMPLRRATLLYDFFYSAVDWAVTEGLGVLASLDSGRGTVSIRLLTSAGARPFQAEESLAAAIASAGGTLALKDLDDAAGIILSFPETGGEADG